MLRRENELHLATAIIDSTQVRAIGGGEASGPSPVDRRKKGTKYTLLIDRDGVSLVIRAAPATCVFPPSAVSDKVALTGFPWIAVPYKDNHIANCIR